MPQPKLPPAVLPQTTIKESRDCTGCHYTLIVDLGDHYGVSFVTCEEPSMPQVVTVYALRRTVREMLEHLTPEEFDQVLHDIPSLNKAEAL